MYIKIISGGQTGVDRAALEVAQEMGYPTGGFAPKGFRTENGPDLSLKKFGLIETSSYHYRVRTELNIEEADGTVLFGLMRSPGSFMTIRLCKEHKKPFLINPDPNTLKVWIAHNNIQVLNVAGNRISTAAWAASRCKDVLKELLKMN